jgi:hypothetical protein
MLSRQQETFNRLQKVFILMQIQEVSKTEKNRKREKTRKEK